MRLFRFSILLALLTIVLAIEASDSVPLWQGQPPHNKPDAAVIPKLDLYPAKQGNGCAVVVCPGGGYGGLAKDHEGHQIAKWCNRHGVSAYVLTYRLGSQGYHFPTQLADVQRAIRLVRSNAKSWAIDPERIGVMGFSAGGHLASMAATKFNDSAYKPADEIDQQSARPDFAVLCYPVVNLDSDFAHKGSMRNLLGDKANDAKLKTLLSSEKNVTKQTPPTFLFHTDEDRAVPAQNSIEFYLALKKHNIPAELHLYQSGPHGVGLFEGDPVLGTWSKHLNHWLRNNGYYVNDFKRASVSGSLNLDGQPISWGTITFHPQDSNLPLVTARIRGGKFRADKNSGPPVGKCRISITGSIWEATGDDADELVNIDWNDESAFSEVTIEEGAKFKWAVESKK